MLPLHNSLEPLRHGKRSDLMSPRHNSPEPLRHGKRSNLMLPRHNSLEPLRNSKRGTRNQFTSQCGRFGSRKFGEVRVKRCPHVARVCFCFRSRRYHYFYIAVRCTIKIYEVAVICIMEALEGVSESLSELHVVILGDGLSRGLL